ncbi:MAG: ABC transporter substrate-binding protein [Firmicutes bacterium]|nr:ABC transporter substrate-binding protein [Bacillota bacterium]
MKRILIAVLVIILAAGAGMGLANSASLSITYNPMPFNLPSMVEKEQKLLEQQGLKVAYSSFQAGFAMTEAMAAKELDIAVVMGATSAITSKAGGRDIKIVAAYSQAPSAFALVTRPDGIELKDLKGAKIAVPVGTEAHYLLAKILKEQGLTFNDIEVINMMVPDGVAALQAKQVDAAMAVEPVLSRLEGAGQIRVLRNGVGLISGLTVSTIRGDLVGDERVEKFLTAQQHALQFISENNEEALAIAQRDTGLPRAIIEKIAPKYNFSMEITEEVKASLEETIEFLYAEGLIQRKISVEDLLLE